MKLKINVFILLFFLVFSACTPSTKPLETSDSAATETANSHPLKSFSVKTYANNGELDGFGYDIYIDSSAKPTVHQPNVPAVAGNRGFATEEEAKKIGEYVANKIKNNIMPPSVTVQELDSLGVK